jgi:phosphoribosyl 1,2-cyclic phosphodiesterase
MYEDQPAPLPSPARFIPARAGASRCGCAGRTAPSIHTAGLARLDFVVLSHEDNDHLGGALTVLESLQADALASSLPWGTR